MPARVLLLMAAMSGMNGLAASPAPGPRPIDVSDEIRRPLGRPGRGPPEPRMINQSEVFAPANYPFFAKAREDEGLVRFVVTVDASGIARDCIIVEEAEAETLNQPTCDLIMAEARFEPARDRRGRAIAASFSRPVRWVLEDRKPLPVIDSHQRVVLTFDGGGKTDCRIEASADAETDPRTCAMVIDTPMVRGMAGSRAAILRGLMARFAVVSENSSFTGPDAEARATMVGKRPGEDLNDRTITRVTIAPDGRMTGCTVVEAGMAELPGEEGKSLGAVTCERLARVRFVPATAGGERTVVQVSAAYYRAR